MTIVTQKRYESVWDAIEETAGEAQKLRSRLVMALQDHIARAKLNQAQAAKLFGVAQPRTSNLMHRKIDLFNLDTLVTMAASAGMRVEMRLCKMA